MHLQSDERYSNVLSTLPIIRPITAKYQFRDQPRLAFSRIRKSKLELISDANLPSCGRKLTIKLIVFTVPSVYFKRGHRTRTRVITKPRTYQFRIWKTYILYEQVVVCIACFPLFTAGNSSLAFRLRKPHFFRRSPAGVSKRRLWIFSLLIHFLFDPCEKSCALRSHNT